MIENVNGRNQTMKILKIIYINDVVLHFKIYLKNTLHKPYYNKN